MMPKAQGFRVDYAPAMMNDTDSQRSPLRAVPDELPGASARRRAIALIRPVLVYMFISGMAAGATFLSILTRYVPVSPAWSTLIGLAVMAITVFLLWRYVAGAEEQIDRYHKGSQGEVAVAQALHALSPLGYQALHDLSFDPASGGGGGGASGGGGGGANIDHVLIGPGGVFVIETKYRSKNPGEEITFDGQRLTIAGRGICEGAVGQTLGNARRIAEALSQVTGRRVETQPVLVFAGGWYIRDTRPSGQKDAIWVLNDDALIKWIRKEKARLSSEDIALYTTRLREWADHGRKG